VPPRKEVIICPGFELHPPQVDFQVLHFSLALHSRTPHGRSFGRVGSPILLILLCVFGDPIDQPHDAVPGHIIRQSPPRLTTTVNVFIQCCPSKAPANSFLRTRTESKPALWWRVRKAGVPSRVKSPWTMGAACRGPPWSPAA